MLELKFIHFSKRGHCCDVHTSSHKIIILFFSNSSKHKAFNALKFPDYLEQIFYAWVTKVTSDNFSTVNISTAARNMRH